MKKTILALTGMLLLAPAAFSQTPPPAPPPGKSDFFFYQQAGSIEGLPFNLKPVLNAPYQGQTETEIVEHLADGNVIQNTHTSKIARDSQGRTWTEQTIDKIGPWSSGEGSHTVVFISDPVAGYSYVLHPDSKTAERMVFNKHGSPGPTHMRTMIITKDGSVPEGFPPPPPGKMGAQELGTETSEDLGVQQINGVTAQGKRVTHTIPANTIGNQLPLVSVNETWYSPDLQTMVQSKRDDPRFGETTFSLKSIQKGEPPASLFQVPADYTMNDAGPVVKAVRP
jgi:hypothetical protein